MAKLRTKKGWGQKIKDLVDKIRKDPNADIVFSDQLVERIKRYKTEDAEFLKKEFFRRLVNDKKRQLTKGADKTTKSLNLKLYPAGGKNK